MTAAHPGYFLRQLRAEKGWTQADLSHVLGRPAQMVSEIESGRKRVTASTALQLEAAFGVEAMMWLTLQAALDLERARSG